MHCSGKFIHDFNFICEEKTIDPVPIASMDRRKNPWVSRQVLCRPTHVATDTLANWFVKLLRRIRQVTTNMTLDLRPRLCCDSFHDLLMQFNQRHVLRRVVSLCALHALNRSNPVHNCKRAQSEKSERYVAIWNLPHIRWPHCQTGGCFTFRHLLELNFKPFVVCATGPQDHAPASIVVGGGHKAVQLDDGCEGEKVKGGSHACFVVLV